MSLKKLLILLLVILFTVLQCTLLNRIRIFNSKPDLLLILIVFFSFYYGRSYALSVGALCGIFTEATCGMPAGYAVFTYSLGGLLLGHFASWLYPVTAPQAGGISKQTFFSGICISFIFTFAIYFFLALLFLHNFNTNLSLFKALIFIVFPTAFYTAISAPIILRFLKTVLNIIK